MTLLHPKTRSWRAVALAFAASALIAIAWGSLVQTQFNLNALVALGVEMPLRLRLLTSAQDLAGFGPVYAGILLAGWIPAFLVAAWLAYKAPRLRVVLFALAAGAALVLAVRVTDAVAPMPVLIDATRGLGGLLTMAAGSALGGALFARWTRK
ncbi:hypothetical protein [Variovorax sp. PAMC 28711]|uniref:hypothetical protein n=1 Tax=Variovorax sp. PAMC 28711 TaxID=1795631 RepID=UPI00078D95A0|nr:hypothetical protein [Variovorax sp. PAMC 28711]AMM24180.1 hypothetical protein AX767_07325 [Variovorax sp. PAMC 28711]